MKRRNAPADSVRREFAHRRAIMLGTGALVVLATSPLIGHHLPLGLRELLAGKDHLLGLCLLALHELADPVHDVFHLLLAAGFAYAAVDRVRAWGTARRALRPLPAIRAAAGDTAWRAARAAGLDPAVLRLVPGLPAPAFTAGLLRPRVFLASDVANVLSFDQLVVLLAHEASHVRRRDPLRLSALRFLSHTLFWMPGFRALTEDAADEAEIRADDDAARGRPLVLASAILALASPPLAPAPVPDSVGFAERDLVERRVRRLAGEPVDPAMRLSRRALIGAVAILMLVWTSTAAVTHPLPFEHAGLHHCHHDEAHAVTHLFCRGLTLHASPRDCPHEVFTHRRGVTAHDLSH